MSTTPQRQVHPAASAVLILLGLVGVQWAWSRGKSVNSVPAPSQTDHNDNYESTDAPCASRPIDGNQDVNRAESRTMQIDVTADSEFAAKGPSII